MAYDGVPAIIARMLDPQEDKIDQIIREFQELVQWRGTTASHWEEVSELIDPNSRNTFQYGNFNWPGAKKTQQQIDSTGMMALARFQAICDSLLTPRNSKWHMLGANDDYVMKDRQTRLWFETATNLLFKYRYSPIANFASQNSMVFRSNGAYGTGGMMIDSYRSDVNPSRGVRYQAIPVGQLYFSENDQGEIDRVYRHLRYTARQITQRWKDVDFPESVLGKLRSNAQMPFDIIHCVKPRGDDFERGRLDARGMRFSSTYVLMDGRHILQEGGYHSFPFAISRYTQSAGELYGRSPAMDVLPALKTLNAQKRTFLKQAHRAADPVLLTADDGIVDFSLRPGALNKGGVTAEGRPLVHALQTGNIQITKEAMAEEKSLINDAFLVTLFQILTETPQMTATEVIERTNEKGILLAPTMGRQQSEYLGPLIDRELDVLSHQGLLPPMPPRLREAQGEYQVVYTSPLSRAMRAQEAAGFMRTLENVKELAAITQDPSLLDPFNFDVAIPAIAEIQAVPESWMSSPEEIAQKRKNRAQQQKVQQQIQAAPAQAAMMKAQAAQAKAGMPQQQQPGQGP